MLTQTITNTLPVFDVISAQEITLPKSTLKINSLVDINVIDKAQSLYRIIAGGKVFETRLPLNVNLGESFIATVVNNNPTVFRLNNLLNLATGDNVLEELLLKLNLPVSEASKNILRNIIESDKPIIKSKLKKLIELITSSETELDSSSSNLFAQLIWASDGFVDFDKDNLKHFYYSFDDLAQKILVELNHLYKNNPYDAVFGSLNNWLLIDEDVMSSELKLMIYLMKHFESSLSDWLDDKSNCKNATAYSLLNSYYIQLQYRRNAGLNNGMFLIKNEDELQYVSYEFKFPEQQEDVLFFKLQMNPSTLGRINIDGYYSQNNIKINFTSTSHSKEVLESNTEELTSALNSKARLTSSITTNVFGPQASSNLFQLFSNRSINVTA
jgi:hypothetical protein